MDIIDQKTEDLIRLYLKFTTNQNISPESFLKFRKQAIKESRTINSTSYPTIIKTEESITTDKKKATNQYYQENNNRNFIDVNQKIKKNDSDTTKIIIDNNDEFDEPKSHISNEMFLSMIKDIQD